MSRRKGEITGLMNERDFRPLVELALPSSGFRSQTRNLKLFTENAASQSAGAATGIMQSDYSFGSASQTLLLPMHSARNSEASE